MVDGRMRIVTDFPHSVRLIEHFWITLGDGTRLAARAWLPSEAESAPVPALLEYLPYRKGDGTDVDDATRHHYFAGHGFASLRVDIRGSGDSDGVLTDEYSEAELADGVEVIAWIAAQRWCNGRVGLMGISWGGFNALQIAVRQPPALAAIVTVCATDDRYADDVHYMGGAVLARDMLGWAMTLLAFNARPPDPGAVGAGWRDAWIARVASTPAFIDTWLAHTDRDEYWRHGSVCEDYAALRCPTLVVGGWADGYTNAVFRLLANLPGIRRGLVGPWAHNWPHAGRPGPRIGFLEECLRWWRRWLRDEPTGVEHDPELRVYIEEPGALADGERVGAWRGGDTATKPHVIPVPDQCVPADLHHGESAGMWCPFGPTDLAGEQSTDDGRCAVFDFLAKSELVVLGRPVLTFRASDPSRGGHVIVRLCEVDPRGTSTLLTWGIGRLGDGRVELNAIGRRLPATHTIRLALARSYWPVIWPDPDMAAVDIEQVTLSLPLWHGGYPIALPTPALAPPGAVDVLEEAQIEQHQVPGRHFRRIDSGRVRHGNGVVVSSSFEDEMTIDLAAPLSATVRCARRIQMAGDDWQIAVSVSGSMRAVVREFVVDVDLTATADDSTALPGRRWQFRIPRAAG
jgi:predicted acyl esterase